MNPLWPQLVDDAPPKARDALAQPGVADRLDAVFSRFHRLARAADSRIDLSLSRVLRASDLAEGSREP